VNPCDDASLANETSGAQDAAAQDAAAQRRRKHWLNITLAVGLMIASVGFFVETRRALDGHVPAWVYVIEWPLLAIIGFRFWQRLIREDITPDTSGEPSGEMKRESWKEFSSRSRTQTGSSPPSSATGDSRSSANNGSETSSP
jgi:hypothetical protein